MPRTVAALDVERESFSVDVMSIDHGLELSNKRGVASSVRSLAYLRYTLRVRTPTVDSIAETGALV